MTKNMCRSLGIDLIAHKPHNARATGQVEKARDIIERKLEPGLKFRPVHSLKNSMRWPRNGAATLTPRLFTAATVKPARISG